MEAIDPIGAVALLAALGCALMAGLFFAFSVAVMKALAALPSAEGIAAMQSINIAVINPVFLGVFLGTALFSVVLAIYATTQWQRYGAAYLLVGCLLYFVGTFLVTIIFNVPLNNALAAVDPTNPDSLAIWNNYLSRWTLWNHIRTVAALASTASLIFAFVRRAA